MGVWENIRATVSRTTSRLGRSGRVATSAGVAVNPASGDVYGSGSQHLGSLETGAMPPVRRGDHKLVGATKDVLSESGAEQFQTFSDANITYSGSLAGFDYTQILREKQKHIVDLYKLSDYYYDADPIYGGVIKHVYVPFSMISPYRLVGADEKTIQKYEEYYKRINLRDKMESIFLQRYKYYNVFIYIMPDGNIITLPVHKCRIANMSLNGEPIVEYDTRTIIDDFKQYGEKGTEKYIKDSDLNQRLKGFPPEIAAAVKAGNGWAQLDPENVLVIQGEKEDWARYSIPMIAACLPSLAKKALISRYEDAQINLGARGFVHVRYGDEKAGSDLMIDRQQIMDIARVFSSAMNGMPLAVTNQWAHAEFIQADTRYTFEYDKYRDVNRETLAAGGVNSIIVNGSVDTGSNFGVAQISMQTAVIRIERSLKDFADMMNKLNQRMNARQGGVTRSSASKIPTFIFQPLDSSGKKALQEAGLKLYQQGVLSVQSLLDNFGYDTEQEAARIVSEQKAGFHDIFVPSKSRIVDRLRPGEDPYGTPAKQGAPDDAPGPDEENPVGRPKKDFDERTSSPESGVSGGMPKPSQPDNDPDIL